MAPAPTPSSPSEIPQPCPGCGYDLQGSGSRHCPECGAAVSALFVTIGEFGDSGRFNAAAAALADSGIEIRTLDLGPVRPTLGQWAGDLPLSGSTAIRVRKNDLQAARRIVERFVDEPPLPIVDRSEPLCPNCESTLDPTGPPRCPTCATIFQWVEIDEPPIDPTGARCRNCGYELTGNTTDRCPECGVQPPKDLDTLVAAAGADEPSSPRPSADRPDPWKRSWVVRLLLGLFLGIPLASLFVVDDPYAVLMVLVVGFALAMLLLIGVKYRQDR